MSDIKKLHEKAVAEKFANWLNAKEGSSYKFDHFPQEPPDVVLADGSKKLSLEIVTAYYDGVDAEVLWQAARKRPGPTSWEGEGIDAKLISSINDEVEGKCAKLYSSDTILIVYVRPSLTTWPDLQELAPNLKLPKNIPFESIYLSGDFPGAVDSDQGYHCKRLYCRT